MGYCFIGIIGRNNMVFSKMVKTKRIGLWLLALFICVLAIIIIAVNKPTKEESVAAFLNDNRSQLEDIADRQLSGDCSTTSIGSVKVEGVFRNSDGEEIVQFMCSGRGFVSASKYYGFYYSPSDTPAAFQNVDMKLEAKDGTWTWHEGGSDNGGITKKITDGWYYYEAWF